MSARQPLALLFVSLLSAATSLAAPPPGYYDEAAGLTGDELKRALKEIVSRGHTPLGYSSTWAPVATVWEDETTTANLILFYTGQSRPKADQCGGSCNDGSAFSGLWSREHVFPQTEFGSNEPARSDLHALFPADHDVNNNRGNKKLDNVTGTPPALLTGTGCNSNSTAFEVRDDQKGDAARALFYMALRYEGDTQVLNLELVDQTSNSVSTDGLIGQLSTLLAWHSADPPDAFEQLRNDRIFALQGNRNPFVDNPAWATQFVFGGSSSISLAWVNEIHYDNTGADQDEGVELAAPHTQGLSGWTIVRYNTSGSQNGTTQLSGFVPDQMNDFGTVWFPISGLQNAPGNGIALVDHTGTVKQFLSYGATIVGMNGPAVGMTSIDIGVTESSSTPVGHSLQLTGTGTMYTDFSWAEAAPHTRGLPNNSQLFGTGTAVRDWFLND